MNLSDKPTRIACLTPAKSAAIATLAIYGNRAADYLSELFFSISGQPMGKKILSLSPGEGAFGRLGKSVSDEVILTLKQKDPFLWFEIHCHGGIQNIHFLMEQFTEMGCQQTSWQETALHLYSGREDPLAMTYFHKARTPRIAQIFWDQYQGAYRHWVEDLFALIQLKNWEQVQEQIQQMRSWLTIGEHLDRPFQIVLMGAPNVGKSALLNKLAGYQRSIVTPIAGTTRDVVTVPLSFQGWLMECCDTAGIRTTSDEIEAEGILQTQKKRAEADLIIWIMDQDHQAPESGIQSLLIESEGKEQLDQHKREDQRKRERGHKTFLVRNKIDLVPPGADLPPGLIAVSALTGTGVSELVESIVQILVKQSPLPGQPIPYTDSLCKSLRIWLELAQDQKWDELSNMVANQLYCWFAEILEPSEIPSES